MKITNLAQKALACLKALFTSLLRLLLPISTFPYYSALKRNTLKAVEAIGNEPDPSVKNALVYRFLQVKINESNYVQVAGAVVFTAATSSLSWVTIASSHWSASALFYSCIVLALVAIVTGAQQRMVFPGDDPYLKDTDLTQIADVLTEARQSNDMAHIYPNRGLIFALQTPLMLLSLAVVAFLGGLFSVVFSPLASSLLWGDGAKIAVFFGIVNAVVITVFAGSSWWLYEIPTLKPQRMRNPHSIYQSQS